MANFYLYVCQSHACLRQFANDMWLIVSQDVSACSGFIPQVLRDASCSASVAHE